MTIRNSTKGRSEFEDAFAAARARGVSKFSYKGKEYTTKRADRPGEKLTVKDYGDESARMASRTPKMVKDYGDESARMASRTPQPDRTKSYVDAKRRDAQRTATQAKPAPPDQAAAVRTSETPLAPKRAYGRADLSVSDSPDVAYEMSTPEERVKISADAATAAEALTGVGGATKVLMRKGAATLAEKAAERQARGAIRDRDFKQLARENKTAERKQFLEDKKRQENARVPALLRPRETATIAPYRKGGVVKGRDGIAQRGHTKGRYI